MYTWMQVPAEARRGVRRLWHWSYRWLWAVWLECWWLDLAPLQEKYMLLDAEPFLLPLWASIILEMISPIYLLRDLQLVHIEWHSTYNKIRKNSLITVCFATLLLLENLETGLVIGGGLFCADGYHFLAESSGKERAGPKTQHWQIPELQYGL